MTGVPVPFGNPGAEAQVWVDAHAARLAPLLREAHLAEWESAVTGSEQASAGLAQTRAAVKRLFSDPEGARRVRDLLDSDEIEDPLLRRQLQLLHLEFTANQLPPETIRELAELSAALEHTFHTFRATLDGAAVTDNALLEILRDGDDVARRRAAWEASKQIGRHVAEPLRELVRRRNAAARSLGFADFYRMELELQELDEERLFALLDEFKRATDTPFAALRERMDRALAGRFDTAPEELRPWHWSDPFGQEAPPEGAVDLDALFAGGDLVQLAADFFRALGLPMDEVLARSDLWERPGKGQHAFCTDIDREGDVRVLCNLRPTDRWMATLLHELGHAAYDVHRPGDLPFLLRTPAHTLSTEAVAMLMGRLTRDPRWLREAMGAELTREAQADVGEQLRTSMLVSTRWMLVMAHFERALYRGPDREDLNQLWWELVEEMQRIRRPEGRDEPDWAAKIHLSSAPVYYHNYLLGELMTSQLGAAIRRSGAEGWEGMGHFLRDRVFARGAQEDWAGLLVHATGEPLSARFFVEQFVAG
jgi:peptidyl-dipeptidase A